MILEAIEHEALKSRPVPEISETIIVLTKLIQLHRNVCFVAQRKVPGQKLCAIFSFLLVFNAVLAHYCSVMSELIQ